MSSVSLPGIPTAAEPLFAVGRRLTVFAALALVSIIAFEALAVTAVMPVVTAALDGLEWHALAFGGMLAMSVVGMVTAGTACDRAGPWSPMAAGLLLLATGLLLAGFAAQMLWLVAGRLLQGLGSGMIGVAIYVAMARLLPTALHPRLFAGFAAAWVLPAILGPALAGALVTWLGWRSVFLLVAALLLPCACWLLPALARLPAPATDSIVRRPPISRTLLALAAACGTLALHCFALQPEPATLIPAALGAVLVAFAASRLLPDGTLVGAPGMPSVIGMRGLLAASFFCAEVYLPLYLITACGWSVAAAGAALACGALCWSAGSAWQARIVAASDRARWLRRGVQLVALGCAAVAAAIQSDLSPIWLLPGWIVAGAGIGIAFPMLSVLTLQHSPIGEQGGNSAALQISDALASSVLLAAAALIFLGLQSTRPAYAAVIALCALLAGAGSRLAAHGRFDQALPAQGQADPA